MASGTTLDDLWKSLGLDSLPPDAGTAVDLNQTRLRDWEEATVRSGEHALPTEERSELPTLSLKPPNLDGDAPTAERELIATGVLGQGGMGRVLLARQSSLGRDVAVKVPNRGGAERALLHEAETGGSLEHPGIIPVYSLCTSEGDRPALVMKRVDGVVWTMLIRNSADPAWERIAQTGDRLDAHVEILRQVCNAIGFAHRKGVLHRDLKPSNVLIGEFGEVYVADWGIAIRKEQRSSTRRPSLVGSPVYLAPEMVAGDDSKMDERTDVFLLGATLYEVLSGSPPWWGPDLKAVLETVLECKPRALPASAPRELADICMKAMRKNPAERFSTALEFRDALAGYLRHRGSVQLASAAEERLLTLLATMQSTTPDRVYPLLSECRFGFQQALREWPENEVARLGLGRCLQATASFELSRGRLDAARALVAELTEVPEALAKELAAAEKEEAAKAKERARLENLRRQHDVRLYQRERVLVYAITIVAVMALVSLQYVFPSLHAVLLASPWYLVFMMAFVIGVFGLSVFFGRKALLSTALNRRMMGMASVAFAGVFLQRVLGVLNGLSWRDVVLENAVLAFTVCVTGGITLHSGFYASAAAMLAGLLALSFTNGHEPQIFGLSAGSAMVLAILSWKDRRRRQPGTSNSSSA
jgi:serine/threonine-protein kinase